MVTEERFRLPARDGIALAASTWSGDAEPRIVIVVAHGMGEHSGRYLAPFTPLIEDGAVVYALDHRGHGLSALSTEGFGDFGPGGFSGVVADLAGFVARARREYPDLPLVLFAHSMGSMIAQALLLDHWGDLDGLILCGSPAVDLLAAAGANDPEIFLKINAQFEPGRTGFEWLSRDEAQVDLYVADPFCGFALQPESFGDLLVHGSRSTDPAGLAGVGKALPIFIIYGDADPLNALFHACKPLVDRYEAAGLDVAAHVYPGARHELLNETNRDDVVADITGWLEKVKGYGNPPKTDPLPVERG